MLTVTQIDSKIHYLLRAAEQEQAARRCYRQMSSDGYKWTISVDVIEKLEFEAYQFPFRISHSTFRESMTLYGIPVQIDYKSRETIELWRKIQED